MRTTNRLEPHVFFPVVWPAGSTPPDIATSVLVSLKLHHQYVQAVAEIARRNGGGGFLRVELKPDTWDSVSDGCTYTQTIAEGAWARERLELSQAANHTALRAAPTQTCFTVQLEIPSRGGQPHLSAARMVCGVSHAEALRRLEETGLNETTGCILAMDGGATA